jgi:ABC-2 type transport system ATP-binding protein
MISLNHIYYKYPKKKGFALDDISIKIDPGQIYTLLGPNGSGKTTITRILSGLILPKKGTMTICNDEYTGNEYNTRRNIGLVLGDERTFYFRLSGAQNLEFFGGLYSLSRSVLKGRIGLVLEMVGLAEHDKLQYMRYSTGMKKRLSFARALLHDPQVYLLDEPNSGVDPQSTRTIRDIINSLKGQGKTILLTTHDMNEAEMLSDKIGYLKEGRLIKTGSVDEYKRLINRKVFEIALSDEGTLSRDKLESLTTRIKNDAGCYFIENKNNTLRISHNGSFDMNRAFGIINEEKIKVVKVNTIEATLEDVFLKLAG